jgi:hypothetical protein
MKTTNLKNILIKEVSKAELLAELETKLAAGISHFAYTKKDGTTREAYGTTNVKLLGKSIIVNEDQTHVQKKEGVTVYYDLNSAGWRSFVSNNILTLY